MSRAGNVRGLHFGAHKRHDSGRGMRNIFKFEIKADFILLEHIVIRVI
jgi:hypothetical protein